MIKTALIGHNLGHSLSAVIHNAAYKSLGLDGKYEIIDVSPNKLDETVKRLKSEGYSGFNVTIPYKVDVKKYLHLEDILVKYAGCTNCVKINPEGAIFGYNTDIYGFARAIPEDMKAKLKGKKALILGSGGAARAVAVALILMQISQVDFKVRSMDKAQNLHQLMQMSFKQTNFNLQQNLINIEDYSIIVNTTPLGTIGENANKMPVAASELEKVKKDTIIYDVVYNPIETKFVNFSKELDLYTISGLDMLIYQAQKAFKIFTGKEPDAKIMKESAIKFL